MVYIVLLLQSLIASGTHIVAKVVVRDIDPVTLTMIRSTMAAVALMAILLLRGKSIGFATMHRRRLLLLSLLAIPLNQFLFLAGINYSTASNAALLYATTPAAVLTIAHFTGGEQISPKKGIGIVIAFAGVLLVLLERGIDVQSNYFLGNLLLIAAVIAWALYTLLGRGLIREYGAFPTSAATMIAGTVMFLPFGTVRMLTFPYASLSLNHWLGLAYLSLGTSILAYFLWYYALSRIEASKVSIFANLQPILTTALSALLLGQPISTVFVIGGVIVLAGVVMTQYG